MDGRAPVDAIVERIWLAHGLDPLGGERRAVSVRASAGGIALASRGQRRVFADCSAVVQLDHESVTFNTSAGTTQWSADALSHRYSRLNRGFRRLRWTPEDASAFGAQALWTYICLPLLLRSGEVSASYAGPWTERGMQWDRLNLTFPVHITSHSPRQAIYVDATGYIRRHDYVARAFGAWAAAAHYVDDYQQFDGLTVGTRRRVHFRTPKGRALRPVVLWLDIHSASRTEIPK